MVHSDIPQDSHPERRAGCVVLVTLETDDPDDRRNGSVLLVVPSYKTHPILPGGAAHKGELIGHAAARELLEETGLVRAITRGLVVDQTPANDQSGAPEGINFVCDGGTISTSDAMAMAIPVQSEITAFAWVHPDRLHQELPAYQARRIEAALTARELNMGYSLLFEGETYGAAA
ncbi:NUDIX domain-containing protein [Kitasatospora phosalacinea]|uniref:Nudix hydrolase domain-containing protein n=1 Tax=Kitasatospora phosalacinea TaxID=2065 RepID=A0A9W6UNU1_9ACTN|nr:NUDIX domain-containing protein [Kitasatospora phosalacinea]GLW55229.1 hypothetical protein Kpho01_32400 [Kitasatospora phosalacinea]